VFARHYLEMVITMVIGMIVLHPLWVAGFGAVGLPGALNHATTMAAVMATNMSLGMGAWMRFRGHSWRSILEMSAAMYLPFAAFLPPVWAGAMSRGAMITAGHLLMLPTMLALMLWRRDEHGHGGHGGTAPRIR
jgi:flagellar biosynthetic protein FliP